MTILTGFCYKFIQVFACKILSEYVSVWRSYCKKGCISPPPQCMFVCNGVLFEERNTLTWVSVVFFSLRCCRSFIAGGQKGDNSNSRTNWSSEVPTGEVLLQRSQSQLQHQLQQHGRLVITWTGNEIVDIDIIIQVDGVKFYIYLIICHSRALWNHSSCKCCITDYR